MFRIRKRSRLPHWDVDHGTYFITTSLVDAIPHEARVRIDDERKAYIAEVERRLGLTEFEQSDYPSSPGVRRYEKILRFNTIPAVKAG